LVGHGPTIKPIQDILHAFDICDGLIDILPISREKPGIVDAIEMTRGKPEKCANDSDDFPIARIHGDGDVSSHVVTPSP
jgi:hypothetical protein